MSHVETAAEIRADKVSGDLRRGDSGALQGAVDQLRGVVQDDPEQALSIIRRANCESQGAPAMVFIDNGFVSIQNAITGESDFVGQLGFNPARAAAEVEVQPACLSYADQNRADKVSGDLRRGDPGALQGAVTELQGMVKDDPNGALAVIRQVNEESYGAPASVVQFGNRIEIFNWITGDKVNVGTLGGDWAAAAASPQLPGGNCPPRRLI